MLLQGELRNATVHFDKYQILQQHRAVSLYSPTSATVQVLKLHTVR